jgi:hypothetical protein
MQRSLRAQAEISRTYSQRGGRTEQVEGGWWHLPAEKWQGGDGRLNIPLTDIVR